MRSLTAIMIAFAILGGAVQSADFHQTDTACVELHDATRLANAPPSTEAPIRHLIPVSATMPDGLESFEIRPRLA
jgi:hypothetical protein